MPLRQQISRFYDELLTIMQRFLRVFFSIRCGIFLGILQCKVRFLTFVVLPLAGPQIGQVETAGLERRKKLFRLLF